MASDTIGTVLIIDDDPFFIRLLSDVFKENRFAVYTATDGIEGIRIYNEKNPEVVLSDLVMPRMGGVSTCMEITRIAGDRDPIVILLTSMFQEEPHEHDTPEMGARYHFPKTGNPMDVVILVEELLEKKRRQSAIA